MKFSEYLRKLDEGNLGHELEKQEAVKPKVGKNLQKIAAAKPAETADDNAKRKEWRDSLRSTGDDGGAKAARENTVKEPNGETMLDPKTGKPFPKTGPLKDWQIPSLKEDWRQTDPGHTREDEEDVPDKPVNTKRWDGHGKEPEGYEDAGGPIGEDGTAELRKKPAMKKPAMKPVNDSLEIPMRDALGRLSIYSMQEASTPKPLRKALKKANMGKKLSNKESGNVMNNPKADGSTRTNAAENYKNPQADIDANDAAEGEYRSGGEGTPRQSHLDK